MTVLLPDRIVPTSKNHHCIANIPTPGKASWNQVFQSSHISRRYPLKKNLPMNVKISTITETSTPGTVLKQVMRNITEG